MGQFGPIFGEEVAQKLAWANPRSGCFHPRIPPTCLRGLLSAHSNTTPSGSIAKFRNEVGRLGFHADHANQSVQGTPIPGEIIAERGVAVDASCIWRWVQAYAPELNKRCRQHLKSTNKSYRVDETYIKVKGEDKFLYRAVDSTGQTIEFLLTAKRDAAAAKRFFRKALSAPAMPNRGDQCG